MEYKSPLRPACLGFCHQLEPVLITAYLQQQRASRQHSANFDDELATVLVPFQGSRKTIRLHASNGILTSPSAFNIVADHQDSTQPPSRHPQQENLLPGTRGYKRRITSESALPAQICLDCIKTVNISRAFPWSKLPYPTSHTVNHHQQLGYTRPPSTEPRLTFPTSQQSSTCAHYKPSSPSSSSQPTPKRS